MHPYRDMAPASARPDRRAVRDERWWIVSLFAIGALRVAVAVHDGPPLDGEAALALMLATVTLAWCAGRARRRARRWWRG